MLRLDDWTGVKLVRVGKFPEAQVFGDPIERSGPWFETGCNVRDAVYDPGAIVCLIGPRGTGKTRMGCEIARTWFNGEAGKARETGEEMDPRCVGYSHIMDLFMAVKATYGERSAVSESEVLARWIHPDLLVVDEVQERGDTDWENRTFTYILDKRYSMGKSTLLLANIRPADLTARLGASIVSRMQETGGIVECNWPSFRAKAGGAA